MTAIIDYGVGNLFSLKCSLSSIGEETVVTDDEEILEKADRLVLPGVGAFRDAREALVRSGMEEKILSLVKKGKPIMGICLGMQLLFEMDYEDGVYEGLKLIPGSVRAIGEVIPKGLKIPHIGWNRLMYKKESRLFKYIHEGDYVYFVHSYHGVGCDEYTTAVTEYGAPLTASVEKDNVFGCQFHPEKSGETGLSILRAFVEI